MSTLLEDAIEPLAKLGHEAINRWLRKNHHLPYPEWDALMEMDKEGRRQIVLLILNEVQSELNEEDAVFADAVKEQARLQLLLP
jgi:hypothetical protein